MVWIQARLQGQESQPSSAYCFQALRPIISLILHVLTISIVPKTEGEAQ